MAVYTKITFEEAKVILIEYGFQRLDILEGISEGILNTNYLIKGDKGKFILRILEGERDFDEEIKELEFLNELSNKNFPCTSPILTTNNNFFTTYNGKLVALFKFVEGVKLNDFQDEEIIEIGTRLAQLHLYSKGKSIERIKKIEMNYLWNKIKNADLKEIFGENYSIIMDKYNQVKNADFSNLPKGIIHNDIFPDNVFYKESKISGIIDFNDSLYGVFITDIAIIINFWIRKKSIDLEEQKRLTEIFLKTYNKYRKITDEEYKFLDLGITKVALTFIFLRTYKFEVEDNKEVQMEKKDYRDLLYLLNY